MSRIDPLTGQIRHDAAFPPTVGPPGDSQPAPSRQNPIRAIVTWAIVAVLLVLVIIEQRPTKPDPAEVHEEHAGLTITPPGPDERLFAKLAVWGKNLSPTPSQASSPQGGDLSGMFQMSMDQMAGWEPVGGPSPSIFQPPAPPIEVQPAGTNAKVPGYEPPKTPATTRLRAAILAGETLGREAVENRLKLIEPTLDESSRLKDDIAVIRTAWREGADESEAQAAIKSLDTAQVDGFKERHGVFADFVLTRGDSVAQQSLREELRADATKIIVVLVAFGAIVFCAILTGFVLCIVAIVKLSSGTLTRAFPAQIHAERDAPNHSDRFLFIEMLAVFLALFFSLKLLGFGLANVSIGTDAKLAIGLLGQWLVALSILWPMVRGMPARRWREYIGLTAPRGVLREVGAGVVGYLAWLSIYFVAAIIVVVVFLLANRGNPPPQETPGGKLGELLGSNNPLIIFLLVSLTTMWAPLVEETIMRGTLFRLWRIRIGLFGAAIASAAVFASLHGYMPMQLILVGVLGFGFALLREWRGSLIPCMTAHFIHNAVISILLVSIFSLA